MFGEYNNICIKGIAAVAPTDVIDNMEFAEKLGERRAKRQIKLTGIARRHVVIEGQRASDMCCQAAERLFQKLNWERDSIRVLVFVTQSEDVKTPSTAMIIQKRLQIGQDCLAFDVNLGCSGYVSGLQIVSALLNNTGGRALLFCGDGKYENVRASTSTDSLLFGDAGTATAIELQPGNSLLYSQKTDGTRHHLLTMSLDNRMYMDGNAVLQFSMNEVVQSIRDTKQHFELSEQQIDYYVLHQAQKIVLDNMAAECGISSEKVLVSYDEFANTSTATIPLTICHNIELLQKKEKICLYLCGFGVGLAWSSVVINIDTDVIMPVELSDYCYNDLN